MRKLLYYYVRHFAPPPFSPFSPSYLQWASVSQGVYWPAATPRPHTSYISEKALQGNIFLHEFLFIFCQFHISSTFHCYRRRRRRRRFLPQKSQNCSSESFKEKSFISKPTVGAWKKSKHSDLALNSLPLHLPLHACFFIHTTALCSVMMLVNSSAGSSSTSTSTTSSTGSP